MRVSTFTNVQYNLVAACLAAAFLAACGASQGSAFTPQVPSAQPQSHKAKRGVLSCAQITDSTGAQYTAAQVGGGANIDVEYSVTPCTIGIYINSSNGKNTLDHTMVNGAFPIGIYFDNAGNGAHEDHTQICVSGSNTDGTCKSGTSTSRGTGLNVRNTPSISLDHTSVDGYVAGFATNPCPNYTNHMTVDHMVITNATYPWSYGGGNNNFNFNPGHDSPPWIGGSCAGSGVGAGLTASPSPSPSPTSTPSSGPQLLYVTNGGNSSVTAYDEAGNPQALPGSFSGLFYPVGLAYDPSSQFLYVGMGNNGDYINTYDTSGNLRTPSGSFSGTADPYAIAYDPNNGFLYVANAASNTITVYDQNGQLQTLSGSFPGLNGPSGIAYVPSSHLLYVANYNAATVTAYDENGNLMTLPGSWSGLLNPFGILYNPSNGFIYVSSVNVQTVTAYDQNGSQQTLSGSWTGLDYPGGMTYDPHNGFIYVANSGGGVSGSSITAYDSNGNQQALSGSFPGLNYSDTVVVVPASAGPMIRKHHRAPAKHPTSLTTASP